MQPIGVEPEPPRFALAKLVSRLSAPAETPAPAPATEHVAGSILRRFFNSTQVSSAPVAPGARPRVVSQPSRNRPAEELARVSLFPELRGLCSADASLGGPMRRIAVAAIVALLCLPSAWSRPMQPANRTAYATAGELAFSCAENSDFCLGYLAGILDAVNNTDYSIPKAPMPDGPPLAPARVCTITSDKLPKAVFEFLRFLDAHPEMRRMSAAPVVAAAMEAAFPCDP